LGRLSSDHNARYIAIIHGLIHAEINFYDGKTPGKKIDYQMIAVNIDSALIAQACDFDFNLRRAGALSRHGNEGKH